MLEDAGDLAGRHRATLEMERDQDPSAHRVRQRREQRLVRIERCLRLPLRHRRYI
jgi:hypothetical protein